MKNQINLIFQRKCLQEIEKQNKQQRKDKMTKLQKIFQKNNFIDFKLLF